MRYSILLYATIFCLLSNVATAQQPQLNVSADTSIIRIGEQIQLSLQLSFPAQDTVEWPFFNDTITKAIEIVERSTIDTSFDEEHITTKILSQHFTLTSFDSGFHVIPPIKFRINGDTLESAPLLIEVQNIVLDTSQTIKDIKPPIEVTYTFMDWMQEYWHWIVGVILVCGIIFVIYYLLKKRKMNLPLPIIQKAHPKPAHVIALDKLDKLKAKKLWQQDKVKDFHSELSEIIREYIENRYRIMALEYTTDEILTSIRSIQMEEEGRNKLTQLLRLSDLVKFAKEKPIASENDLCMTNAYDFINYTKLIEVIQEKKIEPLG